MSVEITPNQGSGEVSLPEDFAAYAAVRRGETPTAVETSEVQTDESETGTVAESETANDTEQEQEQPERDENGRFKAKQQRGLDKRFHELTSKIRDLEGKLATQVNPDVASPKVEAPKAEGEPQSKDFDSYDEYLDKLTDWKLDQRELAREEKRRETAQREQAATAANAWQQREDSLRDKHEDYDAAITSLKIPQTAAVPAVRDFLGESEHGPALLYQLAKNQEETTRIMQLSPLRAVAEIALLESKLSTPKQQPKTVTNAPAPPQVVGAKSSPGQKPLNQVEDYAEYVARRRKGEKR